MILTGGNRIQSIGGMILTGRNRIQSIGGMILTGGNRIQSTGGMILTGKALSTLLAQCHVVHNRFHMD